MSIYLETQRVILRDWHADDLEEFARINRDPVIMEFYPSRLDDKATQRLMDNFQAHIDQYKYGFFAAEHKETGAFMGFSGIARAQDHIPFAPATELAWRLDYDYWGAHYASEIAHALIEHSFNALKLKELVAYCASQHERADYVLKKIGFTLDPKGNFDYAPSRDKKAVQNYNLYKLKP